MKKIAKILFVCLIVVAIVIVAKFGFKVGLKYSENTQININIGKEFNVEDIKAITNEVFPKQNVMVQQVELYKDMVQITVKTASDDQINDLNSKINDKYGIDNKVSDIVITNNANTKLKSIAKPYIIPLTVSFALIAIYVMIRFNKIGLLRVICKIIGYILVPQVLLFCVYAIFRLPINRITAIASIIIYILSSYSIMCTLIKEKDKMKLEEVKE